MPTQQPGSAADLDAAGQPGVAVAGEMSRTRAYGAGRPRSSAY